MDASMDPNQVALQLLHYATTGNYRALAALGVLAAVWFIRTFALSPAAFGRFPRLLWFKTDRGGVVLNFVVSALGGVGNALYVKQPLTKELLLTSAVNACIAAGVFVSIKRLAGRPAEAYQQATAPIPVPASSDPPTAPNKLPPTTTLLPFIFVPFLTSCAYGKAVLVNLEQCAFGKVPSTVAGITGKVTDILHNGGESWQDDLKTVGKQVGLDALSCAIKSVVNPLMMKKASLDPSGQRAVERGQIYLNRLGV